MEQVDNNRVERIWTVVLGCFAVASTVVGRSFTVLYPEPTDASLFAYMGNEWLKGSILYIDVWEHKPPGIFALVALVFLLFPKSFFALAVVEGLFVLGCIITVYFFMRQIGASKLATRFSTIVASIAINLHYYNAGGMLTEIFLVFPAALSMYFFLKSENGFRISWVILAGYCSGVASIFKLTGIVPFLAQIAFLCFSFVVFRSVKFRHFSKAIVFNSLGVVLAWSPFILYFLKNGALFELLNASILFNIEYGQVSRQSPLSMALGFLPKLNLVGSLVVCCIIGSVFWLKELYSKLKSGLSVSESWPRSFVYWPLIILWIAGDFAGAMAGGRNYRHYFIPLALSLSVGSGLTLWEIFRRISENSKLFRLKLLFFALIFYPLAMAQLKDAGKALFLFQYGFQYGEPVRTWDKVADKLNSIKAKNDTLFIWDYRPSIYFSTDLRSPSRHLDAANLNVWTGEALPEESSKIFWQEIWQDLNKNQPTFIVDSEKSPEEIRRGREIYQQFRDFVNKHYECVYSVGEFNIYQNKGKVRE